MDTQINIIETQKVNSFFFLDDKNTKLYRPKSHLIKNLFLLFIILNLPFLSMYAQNQTDIKFERISVNDGLSQSSVTSIIQDNKGFIWLGTLDGLNRYDGYKITVFRNNLTDSTSIAENNITTLYEDSKGILWIGTRSKGLCMYNKLKNNFYNFKNNPADDNSLCDNYVKTIYEDKFGILWIGTSNGLSKFEFDGKNTKNTNFTTFRNNYGDKNSISNNTVNDISGDKKGNLWIATNNGLNSFSLYNNKFIIFKHNQSKFKKMTDAANKINTLFIDYEDVVWFGTDAGLHKMDINTKQFISFMHNSDDENSISSNKISSILEDYSGNLWIGTSSGGLNKLHRDENGNILFFKYREDPLNPNSLSGMDILTLYESQENALWIGTNFRGINKWDRTTETIKLYRNNPYNENSLSSSKIRCIYEDKEGIFWIGTVDGGLNRWDINTNEFLRYKHNPRNPQSLSNNNVRSIIEDSENNLWIGTEGGGLNRLDRKTGKFEHFKHNPNNNLSLSNDNIWKIIEDSNGLIWIGTKGGGLNFMVTRDNEVKGFGKYQNNPKNSTSLSNNHVTTIFEDSRKTLWVGTFGGGLNKLDIENETFKRYKFNENDNSSIGSDQIYVITEDNSGTIWVGTKGSLNKFDPETEKFKRFTVENGLPNNVIDGILEDEKQGNLWISTNSGLAKFNKKAETIRNYDVKDGLQSNEFLVGSFCKARNGQLLFGGVNGFNVFNPKNIKDNPHLPEVVITNFKLFNEETPLDTFITEKKTILLDYEENFFTFDFIALNYIYSEKNWYAYKMEGFDKKLNYVKDRRYATYTAVPPGKYTFKVIGSNNDGVWNKTGISIDIIIAPPFWQTTWFYFIIIILIFGNIIYFIRWREKKLIRDKRILEAKVKQRTIEINRQKEEILNQATQLTQANTELEVANEEIKEGAKLKEKFLANTSHEIRTPLNIIIGYTNLLLNTPFTEKQGLYLKNIQTSGKNLLVIINDILDFSKIEAGKLTIEKIEFDFRSIIVEIVDAILVKANEKNIQFQYNISSKITQYIYGDPVRLNQIIINLAGNSVKFTPANGKVLLNVKQLKETEDETTLRFDVIDTGIGMTKEQSDKVFESFTQARSDTTRKFGGTGLGLSIVKKLVELQNGDISIKSELNKGSTFSFVITFTKGDGSYVKKRSDTYKINKAVKLTKYNLLLVDDNPVNRALAIDTIMAYNSRIKIDEAENGLIALNQVKKNKYQVIIMDIQMPEMDGLEATKQIRNNLPSPKNKIPILGMSAHAMKEERDKCLNVGMNDYLTKPFVPEELFQKLEELTAGVAGVQEIEVSDTIKVEEPQTAVQTAYSQLQPKHINLAILSKTYKGNLQKIQRILKLCIANIPGQINGLHKNYEEQNWKNLRTVAHSLKTTLNYLGLKDLREQAKDIELNSAKNENLEEIPKKIEIIQNVWKDAEIEINDILKLGNS